MKYFLLALGVVFFSCQHSENNTTTDLPVLDDWEQVLNEASGKKITWMMWQGDPFINNYVSEYVVPKVKEKYNIELEVVSGQGNQIVSTLIAEKEAGNSTSELDMVWINGETFYQLRQINALYGPFVDKLPNSEYLDLNNRFITKDFQQPTDGFECPWGNVQLALIYNMDKIEIPPRNLEELAAWVKKNPGQFTLSNDFTGLTLLKSWMIGLSGNPDLFKGDFSEETYNKYSDRLWEYVDEIKPYLWHEGKTFPSNIAQMHQLYANGELTFTMSNNDGEVDNKILQGLFPKSSRSFVFEEGTIRNSHFLGIVSDSDEKNAAAVVINFLISPEAQLQKMKPSVWGDGTVLDMNLLPDSTRLMFDIGVERKYATDREVILNYALEEPAPEYMIRLFDDFRKKIIEK
ncbi:ABC transporter substrate-binding protein [Marinigracilibium pacificum]|uniref:ABC transporter substrate-binding protein n=1 Tax=Marinigracilibium pacificum TaxID=2729599 RepID=A0A848IZR2_9BACT|nr:ABC transporter substrate-binding protein [Marinigracilibium pacificum]NMM48871.1 ABC transporter substrate-binding protein [Marinigracilibium pacificum]